MNELTEDIYKGAEAGKQKQARRLTTAQLPVYRECSNLLYITIRVMHKAPRKMTRVLDEAVCCAAELCRSIAMANEVRGGERVSCINVALANANTLSVIVTSLGHLGAIEKQTAKDFKKRTGRLIAQCIGWRESATRGGLPQPEGGAA